MDSIQHLIHLCAAADLSEADEPDRSLDQALVVLHEIAVNEGPGAITDAYERAAWRLGSNVDQTEAVIQRANAVRRQASLSA